MSETSLSPKRPRLDFDESSSKDEPFEKYKVRDRDRDHDDHNNYSHSHSKHRKRAEPSSTAEEEDGKDEEGKGKTSTAETARREHTLVMRLTNKEQELQDCMNQIQEMKQAQTQNTAQLRSMLLDPAINLVFQRMAKEMDDHKDKLKLKQNELTAWKFTPDSQTGMRVMARCRMLLQENQELGKMISSGRTARLEGEIVLHKALATEMKKNQKELDEFVGELEEDVEGMQGMIFMLRQQLKEAQEQIARLQTENEQLRTLSIPPEPEPGGTSRVDSGTNTPLHNWAEAEPTKKEIPDSELDVKRTSHLTSARAHITVSASPQCITDSESQDQLAQPYKDFNSSGGFASKVTPDSGVHTQEEDEETSMDATEYCIPSNNPVTQSCDQPDSEQRIVDSVKGSCDGPVTDKVESASISHDSASHRKTPEDPKMAATDTHNGRTSQLLGQVADSSNSNGSEWSNHHPPHSSDHMSPSSGTRTSSSNSAEANITTTDSTCDVSSNEVITRTSEEVKSLRSDSTLATEDNEAAAMPHDDKQHKPNPEDCKTEIHSSLSLDINPKSEEDCKTTVGLVNGTAKSNT